MPRKFYLSIPLISGRITAFQNSRNPSDLRARLRAQQIWTSYETRRAFRTVIIWDALNSPPVSVARIGRNAATILL